MASPRPEPLFRRWEGSRVYLHPAQSDKSTDRRVCLLWINPQLLNRALHHIGSNFLLTRQRSESGKHDVLGINLEEVTQSGPVLATAKAIGAERNQLSRHPLAQALRQNLHIIGRRNERSLRILQRLRHVRNLRCVTRMQHVPALAVIRVAIQLLITCDAPYIRSNAVLLFKNLLRDRKSVV